MAKSRKKQLKNRSTAKRAANKRRKRKNNARAARHTSGPISLSSTAHRIEPGAFPSEQYSGAGEVPQGFRSANLNLAILEFARPFLEQTADNEKEMQEVLAALAPLFVYFEHSATNSNPKLPGSEFAVLNWDFLKVIFKGPEHELKSFIDSLKERYDFLIPQDIQPRFRGERTATYFVRKEYRGPLQEVLISDETPYASVLARDAADTEILKDFFHYLELYRRYYLDEEEPEYSALVDAGEAIEEDLGYLLCETKAPGHEALGRCFQRWLGDKGVPVNEHRLLSDFAESFASFIHDDTAGGFISFDNMRNKALEQFLSYNLFGNVIVAPQDYLQAPRALLLFLRFLGEKGLSQKAIEMRDECMRLGQLFQSYVRDTFEYESALSDGQEASSERGA